MGSMAYASPAHTGTLRTPATTSASTNAANPGTPGTAKLAVTRRAPTTPTREYARRPARSNIRISSQAAPPLRATMRSTKRTRGAATTIHTKSGMATTAVAARLISVVDSPADGGVVTATTAATSHPTEPARPALEIGERAIELERTEVRPHGRGDPQLGVGDLPQEEVRYPHLAAGPDEQVRIGDPVGVERAAHVLLGDLRGAELARPHLLGERAKGVQQLLAPAVVERHHQVQPAIVLSRPDHPVDAAADDQRHPVGPAEHPQADVARHQLGQLADDGLLEQPHQRRHLVLGPRPVLGGEGVEEQKAQAQLLGGAEHGAGGLDTLAVAGHAWKTPARGPASVAVHDDGDVVGERLGPNDLPELPFAERFEERPGFAGA